MGIKLMTNLVKDRHKAFYEVLHNDDMGTLLEYCHKYQVPMPKNIDVAKAGVYKAILHCDDFEKSDKDLAKQKCIGLGFSLEI